jgi:hypothetical protein
MIILPRDHFSWNQLNTWETDRELYKAIYFKEDESKRFKPNRGMKKGKQMADSLESGEASGDILLDSIIQNLPKFEIMDKVFYAELPIGKDKIRLHIQPDTMKKDLSDYYEYKTAQVEYNKKGEKKTFWSQEKADKHGQIDFYDVGIYLLTRKIPNHSLIEIETEKVDPENIYSKLEATGCINIYPTKRGLHQILRMMARITIAIKEISKEYEEFLF